ncbi:hypothetical protein [Glaciecola sp. 1036]|uniref:hypothetical protein n=1 Tax=Alteromonadaceae TaxID=72275 RepID=UPI003CFD8F82
MKMYCKMLLSCFLLSLISVANAAYLTYDNIAGGENGIRVSGPVNYTFGYSEPKYKGAVNTSGPDDKFFDKSHEQTAMASIALAPLNSSFYDGVNETITGVSSFKVTDTGLNWSNTDSQSFSSQALTFLDTSSLSNSGNSNLTTELQESSSFEKTNLANDNSRVETSSELNNGALSRDNPQRDGEVIISQKQALDLVSKEKADDIREFQVETSSQQLLASSVNAPTALFFVLTAFGILFLRRI